MAKPKPMRVQSDDCVITIGDESYALHEGEWVEVIPGIRAGDYAVWAGLRKLQVKLDAIPDGDEKVLDQVAVQDESYQEVISQLRTRVVAWNWTDDLDVALPQPRECPDVFQHLRLEELYWLAGAVKGDTPAQEGNDSRPSETTSSVIQPMTSQARSGGVRSRSRA